MSRTLGRILSLLLLGYFIGEVVFWFSGFAVVMLAVSLCLVLASYHEAGREQL